MNFKRNVIIFVATWCGCGFIPFASGTFGSLATIPMIMILKDTSIIIKMAVLLLIILMGVIASEKARHIFGDNDPKMVVIDEVAGMLIAGLFLPFKWEYIVPAFIIFRFLDIVKPFPIRNMEDMKGGIGIMADDIVAGAMTYGLMLLFLLIYGHGNL
ncbi:MAG: phosphatidylglycerophosphatase A [Deltaproteobacteria bacterium]|nr:MAG: phosphatidylglycerophosphatase A [Deltaproteobacteria bacterium]